MKRYYLLFLMLLGAFSLHAQQRTVTGKVTDAADGTPMPAVSVSLKGSNLGTTTDAEGSFSLEVPDGAVLVVSFIGYATREIPVGNQETLNITLAADVETLSDVVVVGYGTQRKSDLTGAISSVKAEDLKQTPIANVVQGIQGRVSGVQVTQNSAAPGGNISMRIRGTNSINGTSEPLYVIDGVQLSNSGGITDISSLSLINPNDIESVEVLKDASATAIYGARGANGVVLITTKRGQAGATRVTYDAYYGSQAITRKIDMMDAAEYAELENEIYNSAIFEDPASLGEGFNWQDEVFRTAPIQNHQLSVMGGSEKTRFAISANYFDQQGIVVGSQFERYSFRLNFDHQVSKLLSVGANLFTVYSVEDQIQTGSSSIDGPAWTTSIVGAALAAPPVLVPYREDGTVWPFGDQMNGRYREIANPMGFAEILDRNTVKRTLANIFAELHLVEGLTYRANFSPVISTGLGDYYSPRSIVNSSDLNSGGGNAEKRNSNTTVLLHESILTYDRQFGQHSFKFTGVFASQTNSSNSNRIAARNFPNDATANEAVDLAADRQVFSSRSEDRLDSYMGRINYIFKEKYLLDFTARLDGASKFGANNKYGFFPAFAAAWRISEENFAKNLAFLSNLKLRGSYGVTGNAGAIDPYQSLATVTSSGGYWLDHVFTTGIGPTGIPNPALRWEKSTQADIGLDIGLWNNRLDITVDWYHKRTADMLFVRRLPASSGYDDITGNFASLENKGFEFAASATLVDAAVRWDLSGNISVNRNKLLNLEGDTDEYIVSNYTILKVGEPLGTFKTYVFDGIYQTGEAILPGSSSRTGGVKVEDLNGDGQITTDDQRIIGNAAPAFIFGLSTNLRYRNFDLSAFFSGVQGNDIFNLTRYTFENPLGQRNVYAALEDRWSESNPSNEYVSGFQGGRNPITDRFMEDGSFIRCKNITLGYRLPAIKGITGARVYVSGNNLFTITDYSGFDPEVNTFGNSNTQVGIDNLVYPVARSFLFGVQVTF